MNALSQPLAGLDISDQKLERKVRSARGEPLRALKLIFTARPWRSARVIGFALLASIAEGIGLAAFLPLLGRIADPAGGNSALNGTITRMFAAVGLEPTLGSILTIMVAGIGLKAALNFIAMREAGFATAEATQDLRTKLVSGLLRSRWSFFAHLPAGRTAQAVVNETAHAAEVYMAACRLLVAAIQTAVYLLLALTVSWQVTAVAAVCMALTLHIVRTLMAAARKAGARRMALMHSLSNRMIEAVGFFKSLKAMNLAEKVLPLFEHENRELEGVQRELIVNRAAVESYNEPVMMLILAVGLYVGLVWAMLPFTHLALLAVLFYRATQTTSKVQANYQELSSGESVLGLVDGLAGSAAQAAEPRSGGVAPVLKEGIRFENVSFAYEQHQVLSNVGLFIPAGGITALVGPSGAGKTTLLDLLLGLHHPSGGRILADGVDLTLIDAEAWRDGIGYVPQETFLFHDSLLVNVTLNDPRFGPEDAAAALEAAGAGFVMQFPGGLATIAGERGARLSGGQRQRVALARALIRKPRLLVLDEATSSLDGEAEQAIVAQLRKLKGHTTIVLSTHRPGLLSIADHIYRLDKGVAVAAAA